MHDFQLVERLRNGDEGAFTALFERHKAAVYRYALHMRRRDDASADDVVQEVFLAFLRQLAQYDAARGSVVAYLIGIARRKVLRLADGELFHDPLDEATPIAWPGPDPLEGLTRAETVERVRAAIVLLPPLFREAVVLCDLNELEYAAAAEIVGCPIGTVRSRLHRGRTLLMKALEEPWKKTSIA